MRIRPEYTEDAGCLFLGRPAAGVRFTASIRPNRAEGFTLFEILISLFIFSIVVTTVFGSYQAVFSRTDAIEEDIATYEIGSRCLNRMTEDLKAAYISIAPLYTKPGLTTPPDLYRVVGDSFYSGCGSFPRLRFTSYAHLGFGGDDRGGIAEIIYYVSEGRDETCVLKRRDTLAPYPMEFEEKAADPVLCEKVKSLTFTYTDEEGLEHDLWDSESSEFRFATPKSVRIRIETGDDSHSLFFETMVDFTVSRDKIE